MGPEAEHLQEQGQGRFPVTLCGVSRPCLLSSLSSSLHSQPLLPLKELGLFRKSVGKSWKSWKRFEPWWGGRQQVWML